MTQESRAVLLVTDTNRDTEQESWKWQGIAVFMWRKGWMPSRMPRERHEQLLSNILFKGKRTLFKQFPFYFK